MNSLTVEKVIKAPHSDVWNELSDIGNVADFHPMVEKSYLIGGKSTGLGAKRVCEFYNNKGKVSEEITKFDEGKSLTISIIEGTMPMSFADGIFSLAAVDGNSTKVTINMQFKMKGSFLGALMGKVMVKPMMTKTLNGVLESLEVHLTTGSKIGERGAVLSAA